MLVLYEGDGEVIVCEEGCDGELFLKTYFYDTDRELTLYNRSVMEGTLIISSSTSVLKENSLF